MKDKEFLSTPRESFFNKTEQWSLTDTEENYNKALKNKLDIPYGINDITYRYNNYGFRCDNFNSWKNHKYRILFAGCSFTEGTALPLEDTWASVLHKKICKNFNISMPFWSIAVGGAGLDHLSRYLYHVGDLLRPQLIISNLPDPSRRERWKDDIFGVFDADRNAGVIIDDRFITYQTEKNLCFINTLLERWNSNIIFVHNSQITGQDISYMNLNRVIQLKDFRINLENWDHARDGIHAGPIANKTFGKEFFKLIKPIIKDKLKV